MKFKSRKEDLLFVCRYRGSDCFAIQKEHSYAVMDSIAKDVSTCLHFYKTKSTIVLIAGRAEAEMRYMRGSFELDTGNAVERKQKRCLFLHPSGCFFICSAKKGGILNE